MNDYTMVVVIFSAMFKERASTMNDYRGSAMNDYTMVVVIFSATSATPRSPRQKPPGSTICHDYIVGKVCE